MNNKIHNTFPSFDFSVLPGRLVYGAEQQKPTGQDVFNAINPEEGNVDWGKLRSVVGTLDRAGKWRDRLVEEDALRQLDLKEREKLEKILAAAKHVEEETEKGISSLKKAMEAEAEEKYFGQGQTCEDTDTQTVTSIVQDIAGADAVNIPRVTVFDESEGKSVALKRVGDDYHALSGEFQDDHFPIYKGDDVAIGHNVFSAYRILDKKIGVDAGGKLSPDTGIHKENVKTAVGEVGTDFQSGVDADGDALFKRIATNNVGKEYVNEVQVSQAIVDMGIREICKNLFVGEHGALVGVALEEKRKMPKLFDPSTGELKQGALAEITKMVMAAAGQVESTKESEIQADTRRFFAELGLFVGVPTFLNALVAVATGAKLAVVGYFPLVYFDIGRGIRPGKIRVLDRGGVKLLTDLSIVEGEILAREAIIGRDGMTRPSNEHYLEGLRAQKIKLELIGLKRKKAAIDQALEDHADDPRIKAKLENDQRILIQEISSRAIHNPEMKVTDEEVEAYSSKSVNADRNEKYQELQVLQRDIVHKNDLIGSTANARKAVDSVAKNLQALEIGFDTQQDKTERLWPFWKRWSDKQIESPEEALRELNAMLDREAHGMYGLDNRFRVKANFGKEARFIVENILGFEKGETVELADMQRLESLMRNPVEGDIPEGSDTRLLMRDSSDNKKTLRKLEYYFTKVGEGERGNSDATEAETDEGMRELAAEILKSDMSDAEKIVRLSVLASSRELKDMSDRLLLRLNIEEGIQIREAYKELQSALNKRSGLVEFINFSGLDKQLSKVYKNVAWIEHQVDLENLDQNASIHSEINDILQSVIEKIQQLPHNIVALQQNTIPTVEEQTKITSLIEQAVKDLDQAKQQVKESLQASAKEARDTHDSEDVENIQNAELKEVNKILSVPVTEAAFESPADISDFASLVHEFAGSLGSKEAFIAKVRTAYPQYKEFRNSKGTETSNLPMLTPEQVGDAKLARQLNLLVLSVQQEGKNITDDFYDNSESRSRMHLRDSEIAAAVGQAEWVRAADLENYLMANTGRGNTEDLNHFIEGAHSGGDFGGAWRLRLERNITLADGRAFKVTYDMFARQKCFNAVFIPNGGIEEIPPTPLPDAPQPKLKSLTPTDIAAVQRQLVLLGIPLGKINKSGDGRKSGLAAQNPGQVGLDPGTGPGYN